MKCSDFADLLFYELLLNGKKIPGADFSDSAPGIVHLLSGCMGSGLPDQPAATGAVSNFRFIFLYAIR